ncbi:MAG: hypothetical protein COV45_05660 [Deltaproteobacteria bacterium CG11_big_fil_rev_8_21_14_0_20_47_16]|nr:MAG: hypothetical protein COV45_05660 [Deltaproteobacteria bacterium CG11_big_fil_rev_8_21_14_0_20_47_16]
MLPSSCRYILVSAPAFCEEALIPIWVNAGTTGFIEEDSRDRKVWKVFFNEDINDAALQDCVEASELVGTDVRAALATLPLEDWGTRWMQYFKPVEIAPQLVVTTDGVPYHPKSSENVITIVAGMAFGTGQHATTQLIARAIVADFPSRKWHRMLDMGTGSGILGLVGLMMGVAQVDGVDNDGDALEVAKENAFKNGKLDRFFLTTTLSDIQGPYPVIVANILLNPLVEMVDVLVTLLSSNGDIYLSGIVLDQVAPLRQAYESKGLTWVATQTQGEWAMLHLRKN